MMTQTARICSLPLREPEDNLVLAAALPAWQPQPEVCEVVGERGCLRRQKWGEVVILYQIQIVPCHLVEYTNLNICLVRTL